jgi:hypothetical protein
MKRLLAALTALCVLLVSAKAALPEAGTYSGMLIMSKPVLGTQVRYNIRALAEVSADGTLKIALLTTPSPLINPPDEIALQTKIEANGSCVIPNAPWPPLSPPLPPGPGTITINLSLGTPIHFGYVQVAAGMFTLTYDNAQRYFIRADGTIYMPEHVVAPIASATYKFSFRKVTPSGVKITVY